MYVCICKGITDNDIAMAVEQGITRLSDLRKCTGVASQCAKCAGLAKSVMADAKNQLDSTTEFFSAV